MDHFHTYVLSAYYATGTDLGSRNIVVSKYQLSSSFRFDGAYALVGVQLRPENLRTGMWQNQPSNLGWLVSDIFCGLQNKYVLSGDHIQYN